MSQKYYSGGRSAKYYLLFTLKTRIMWERVVESGTSAGGPGVRLLMEM